MVYFTASNFDSLFFGKLPYNIYLKIFFLVNNGGNDDLPSQAINQNNMVKFHSFGKFFQIFSAAIDIPIIETLTIIMITDYLRN